jgi:branched-chain amino acid transport system ATP-binding protein
LFLTGPKEALRWTSLTAASVGVRFGGLSALSDVNLEIKPGEVVGLIGPNGAGKTTMVNVLTGFQRPTTGEIRLGDRRLVDMPAAMVRWHGISRTFQAARLFRDLTVQENIVVAAIGLGFKARRANAECERVVKWMGIEHLLDSISGTLPFTDQRRVAIARAIVGNPAFVLLDEPAAGMSEEEGHDLSLLVSSLAQEMGTGVLVIEHNITLVLNLCTRIYVLDSGKIIEHGASEAIRTSAAVRHAYIGTALDEVSSEWQVAVQETHQ